ncbi:hypothetical protein BGX24_001892, partial [Mortierella sp. AD032]
VEVESAKQEKPGFEERRKVYKVVPAQGIASQAQDCPDDTTAQTQERGWKFDHIWYGGKAEEEDRNELQAMLAPRRYTQYRVQAPSWEKKILIELLKDKGELQSILLTGISEVWCLFNIWKPLLVAITNSSRWILRDA